MRHRRLNATSRLSASVLTAALTGLVLMGAAPPAHADPTNTPVLGAGKVQADINGDGYADLIISGITSGDEETVGSVAVLYGSATGLTTTGQQRVDGDDLPGIGPDSTPFNPGALAAGDFNGDGYSDLAVGQGSGDVGSVNQAGVVYVIPGSASGLVISATKVWSQATRGVSGSAESGDDFGNSLAAADFGGGSQIDLAIGVRAEVRGGGQQAGSGQVQVLYGSSTGLTATGSQVWSQNTRGVPGKAEEGDFFGDHLAAGDFDGRNKADLAVGTPFEDVGRARDAGSVTVLYSSASKLSASRSKAWSQDSAGLAGKAEFRDYFGLSLAAGNFTAADRDDLVVGAAGEEFSGRSDTGSVYVLRSTGTGLKAAGSQVWTLPKLGAPAGTTDRLGDLLVAADFGRNPASGRRGDLVIGSYATVNDPLATPSYLLYGAAGGLGQVQALDAGYSAAADFNSKDPGAGYADLAGLRPGAVRGTFDAIEVFSGATGGLSEAGSQVIPLDTVNLPAGADSFGLSAAGSP